MQVRRQRTVPCLLGAEKARGDPETCRFGDREPSLVSSDSGEEETEISINSENIFPIIKKWLYSDHDIFYRELISNGCDAITKLKKLEMMGEYKIPEDYKARIDVEVDPRRKRPSSLSITVSA